MVTLFTEVPFAEVVLGLHEIGYDKDLLKENYKFTDWFSSKKEEREIDAAAFGQTPISYDSACIGVARANGASHQDLVNKFRALAAPIILEVDNYEVREWAVSRNENEHKKVGSWPADRIREMIERRAPDWKPQPLLRAKNLVSSGEVSQLSLFAGLLPELEEHIQAQLEPLLRSALSATKAAYRDTNEHDPSPPALFKLIFWILTAKVFHDRHVKGFISLGPDPDAILNAVARQYDDVVPRLLTRKAREVAVACIWDTLDFRNLSVEVLAQIWSTLLIDDEIKKNLGIHRTPRAIVRYIVERIPFNPPGDDPRIIFEPCSGSASFLIGAMNFLRPKLFLMTPNERHRYFVTHLAGLEKDDFGVEISHLSLALADFPNLTGWTKNVTQGDVFDPGALIDNLRRSAVVLCNPPFENLGKNERQNQIYSPKKPVELLNRVLDDLHPNGVLGFVLPRNFVDGRGGYAEIRKRLAKRFASIEVTVLPDKAFEADTEVGLLIATEPIPHGKCQIAFNKVDDDAVAWRQFELMHKVSSESKTVSTVAEAADTFVVPELPNVWDFLINYPTLGEVAKLHRGIEWNEHLTVKGKGKETGKRAKFERGERVNGFELGVASRTKFNLFEKPRLSYLSLRPEHQKGNAFRREWNKPKAIMNKATKSRQRWRIAAFPDSDGITCYQNYIGVWPESDAYDEWVLSAILNSPVANAFVATREGKTDITMEVLRLIPVPHFTAQQRERLRSLIKQYQSVAYPPIMSKLSVDPARLLMEIDALVLDGYRMPPRLERELLDYFRGQGDERATSHAFGDYFPPDFEMFFSLSDYLSPEFAAGTAGELMRRLRAG